MVRPVLAAVALLLAAAPAASAKRCSTLHGKDLAPAKHVRLVAKPSGLRGCILPRGPVRELASDIDYETETSDYAIVAVAREWVMLDTSDFTQYGGGSATTVVNIRTDRG